MVYLNSYGKFYTLSPLNGIVMEEFEPGGYVSPTDIHKLKQIYSRTNGDKPPPVSRDKRSHPSPPTLSASGRDFPTAMAQMKIWRIASTARKSRDLEFAK